MRLACVKHAASVRSEPGSNSQVHLGSCHSRCRNEQTRTHHVSHPQAGNRSKRHVTHSSEYANPTPRSAHDKPKPNPGTHHKPTRHKNAARVSLLSTIDLSKNLAEQLIRVHAGSGYLVARPTHVNGVTQTFSMFPGPATGAGQEARSHSKPPPH